MLSALYLSGIAAWFSIVGILTMFSGAQTAALCMGVGIEVGKVVGVSWLYRTWETSRWTLKIPALILCLVAMLVTSAGIFGFLSKAHFQQNTPIEKVTSQVNLLDQKIQRQRAIITDSQNVINQLDQTIEVLLKNEKISSKGGARDVRALQREERDVLNSKIENAQTAIASLEEEKFNLVQSVNNIKLEVEVIGYLSQLLYGEDDPDKAIKIMIALIMACFDPFAIILLMCGNQSMMSYYKNKELKTQKTLKEDNAPEIELVSYTFTANFKVDEEEAPHRENEAPENYVFNEDDVIQSNEDMSTHNDGGNDSIDQGQKSKEDKEVRLEKIRSKLKRGEIGWISPKK